MIRFKTRVHPASKCTNPCIPLCDHCSAAGRKKFFSRQIKTKTNYLS